MPPCCCTIPTHHPKPSPEQYDYKKPIYQIEASMTKTGTAQAYQPKGAWNNPQKRNWIKYEAWKPPSA